MILEPTYPGRFAGHVVFKISRVGSVGSRSVQNLTGRVGSRGSQYCGSGQVGSRVFFKSHGSGRVKIFSNLTGLSGRVGSGQEVIKAHGSGQVMIREKRVTRGSGQRDPTSCFLLTRVFGLRIRHLQRFSRSLIQRLLVPILNSTRLV